MKKKALLETKNIKCDCIINSPIIITIAFFIIKVWDVVKSTDIQPTKIPACAQIQGMNSTPRVPAAKGTDIRQTEAMFQVQRVDVAKGTDIRQTEALFQVQRVDVAKGADIRQ